MHAVSGVICAFSGPKRLRARVGILFNTAASCFYRHRDGAAMNRIACLKLKTHKELKHGTNTY
jgi:hypothetical protein